MHKSNLGKSANDIPKVKIVVVGDSGVGKSSLVHLITQEKPLHTSSWTIGCNVEVKLHEYHEGTPSQKTFFVELWDIGGNNSHKNSRHVFESPAHGIVLVHDLSNRKSQQNLHPWLDEVLKNSKGDQSSFSRGSEAARFSSLSRIPVFVVGTRLDQVSEYRSGRLKTSSIADRCGAGEIFMNCLEQRFLAPGSNNAVKLSRFFDRVIECRTETEKRETFPFQDRDTTHVRRTKTSSIISMPIG